MFQTYGAVLAAGLILSAGALAQNTNAQGGNNPSGMDHSKMNMSGKASAADLKFAREAAVGGMEEVELGRVAVQNASNDQVKQFGQRMIDDHTKANDELKSIAAKQNITLPTDLDAKHRAMVDRMKALKGAEFDRTYMKNMVQDHEHDIAEFQKEASSGSDSDIQGFASRTLPTLQDHLRMAQDAAKAVGAGKR
jgi:putative membrane protein